MKRTFYLLKTLLVAVGLCVGANAWAYEWTQKADYNFEDGTTTPFTNIPNGAGRVTTSIITDDNEGSKVWNVTSGGNLYGKDYYYAIYDFSSLTSDASAVKAEFDFKANGTYSCFTLRDANAVHGHTKQARGTGGAFISIGSMRVSSTNVFGINGARVNTGTLDTWYHAEIIVDLTTNTLDYTIKTLDQTSTIIEQTGQSFYGTNTSKCTQLDFYGIDSNTSLGSIDNIKIFSYVSSSDHNYTINAIAGGTTLKELTTGKCSEGAEYSFTSLPKVVLYNGKYYSLNDNTVTGYSTETYTMGNSDETREINYTLDESIIFFLEGETLGQSTLSSSCSSGAYSNYYAGPYNISITNAGTYNLETYVASRNTNSSLEVYTNYSNNSVAQIARGGALGERSCSFVAAEGSIMRVGGPYYDDKFQNSLGFDYILIRKTGTAYTLSKPISSAGWATYCSPYALDFSSSISGLTAAYLVTGGSDGVLTLSDAINTTVPANTGLLLNGTEGTITIPVAASGSLNTESNKLVGVTSTYELAADGGYVLLNGENGVGFYINPNEAFTVGANTAYLPVGFAAARAFYLFDEDATGINAVSTTKAETGDYYNLAGQRVAQPTKGLYIVNGKKYVVK